MRTHNRTSKQSTVPLSILLQDVLRIPDRTIRGRLITKGIASLVMCRISEVCPDREAQQAFIMHIQSLSEAALDRQLIDATAGSNELANLVDRVIIDETALGLGDRVRDSGLVEARMEVWRSPPNLDRDERFRKAEKLGEQRRRGDRSFPLIDPNLPKKARVLTDELKTVRKLLLTQFPAQRSALKHSELERRFCDVAARGASPNLAATCDKWCAFFSVKGHNRMLLASLASPRKIGPRQIVLEYLAHFTGHTSAYLERVLRAL